MGLTAVDLLSVCLAERQEWKKSTGSHSCIPLCVVESLSDTCLSHPHFTSFSTSWGQTEAREAELCACVRVNTWGATDPITCMFTTVWEVLGCFGKGFLGAKHPPKLDGALQQREACGGLHDSSATWQSAQLSLCTDMSHFPADEQKAATFVSCLSQCSAKGRSPFPAFSLPEPAYFGCACPILQGSLALLPSSLCWDLAAALTSPARAEGPVGLSIKSSFFCLQADTGVCLGQD